MTSANANRPAGDRAARGTLATANSRSYALNRPDKQENPRDFVTAAARRHVLGNFSWTRALQGLMARYQAAVSARDLPAATESLTPAGPAS